MKIINTVIALAVSLCCVAHARPVATAVGHKTGRTGVKDVEKFGTTTFQTVKDQESVKREQQFNASQVDFLESLKTNNPDPVQQMILKVKNTPTVKVPQTAAKRIAQYLVEKSGVINQTLAKDVYKVMQKHPSVAQAVETLSKNVSLGVSQFSPNYLGVVLRFVASLKNISPLALSAESVTAESVVLNLGSYVGEIASSSWSKEQRASVMALITSYVKHQTVEKQSPENAMKQALADRGYSTVIEQSNRLKDIKESCRKG